MSNQVTRDEPKWGKMEKTSGQDAIFTNIHNMTIAECQINMFRILIDEVGPNQALEAIKPINIFGGKMIADVVKRQLGLQGDDVETVAMPYYVAHCGTSQGQIKPMEIREGKAIIELYACAGTPFNAPPEMCVAVSHYLSEGMCEATNPAYEFVFTHHLANGDDCCRYIVKKKTDKFSLDNPGRLEKTIPIDLPKAELDMWLEMETIGQLGTFTYASVELIGSQRTMELVAPIQRNTGLRLGAKFKKEAGGKSDLSTLRDGVDLLCRSVHQTVSSASITESGIEKEITDCPFKQYFPANPNSLPPPEMCMQLEEVLKGVCEAINHNYEFTFDRMMAKGDPTCHWVVSEKAVDKEARQQEPITDDSLGY